MPILMTPKGRTDLLTRLSELMGLRVAKGSLEGGGRHALLTLLEQLKAGTAITIPADGAHGPERKCKAGAFILAQETGAPIVPVSWKAKMQVKLPRKNCALYLPLPFNSIEIKLGSPITVSKHHQFAELEGIRAQLTNDLDKLWDY